jgi:hypothetical protein
MIPSPYLLLMTLLNLLVLVSAGANLCQRAQFCEQVVEVSDQGVCFLPG